MDIRKLEVVVSEQYTDDLKNIFQYGLETFGYPGTQLIVDLRNAIKLASEKVYKL